MASFKIKPLSLKGITVKIGGKEPVHLKLGDTQDFEIGPDEDLHISETPDPEEEDGSDT